MTTQQPARSLIIVLVAGALGAGVVVGRWAHSDTPKETSQREAVIATATETPPVAKADAAPTAPSDLTRYKIPVTRSQPSQGKDDALVTIVEWCDLQGTPCAQSDALIKKVLAAYPDQVRRVYRHFSEPTQTAPTQIPHQFAHLAHDQAGKFWEVREWLMALPHEASRADVDAFAARIGMDAEATKKNLDRQGPLGHIVADRAFAEMFYVADVPAIFVNGRRIPSGAGVAPSYQSVQRVVDEELKAANQLVQSGVTPDRIYAELTKDGVWRSRRNSSEPPPASAQ